ncbi:Tyrosine-type recombinase/integrase [Sulfidibacter corallicola]|uniref:Tyrosine-type recombinase/integrase n=1 Tax=Sulfidibacter corallicola TaxID=2818388 RepID=A0A8A4TP35_SULCO|nr:tyrosine-type recombinase/integrase [Sulfidibacter corallicola]QTD50728.1 tyrosine-type recombinase/integrase [Sulfidibacter corallicola]
MSDVRYHLLTKFIKETIYPHFKGYHSLRHSNATSLLRRGVDINLISKLLRHSSTKVTEMYAKLIPEDLRQTVDVLDY